MAAFFKDTFSSGSTLVSRTPDTPFASLTWVTETRTGSGPIMGDWVTAAALPAITGGSAYSNASGDGTGALYGGTTNRSLTESFTVSWIGRTTATTETTNLYFAMVVYHGGEQYELRAFYNWTDTTVANTQDGYPTTANLSLSTSYPGSLTYDLATGNYILDFMGQVSTTNFGAPTNSNGFTGIAIYLGAQFRLDSIEANPYAPPTGVFNKTLDDITAMAAGGGDVRVGTFPFRLDDATALVGGGGSLQTFVPYFYGLTSTGTGGTTGNDMIATLGNATLNAGFGGRSINSLRAMSFLATGYPSPNDFVATLDDATFVGQFGLNAINTLPAMSFTGVGTSTVLGQVIGTLGSITSFSAGTTGGLAQMVRTLSALPPLVSNTGAVLVTELGGITSTSIGAGGGVGTLVATLSRMTLQSTATRGNFGSMIQTLDSIQAVHGGQILGVLRTMTLTATGHAVVAVTYEAYAINLNPSAGYRETPVHEVTRYTNYPFNRFIRHGNNWYGVADDGLYLLGGTTDYAVVPTKVPWAFNTAMTDFGSSQEKHVREVFVAGRLSSNVAATVSINEGANKSSTGQVVRGSNAKSNRVKYARGLASRYWSFGFSGTDEIELDALEFDEQPLTRKL